MALDNMERTAFKIIILSFAVLILGACTKEVTGPVVIQGEIEGNPDDVVVVSYLPGQEMTCFYPEVHDGEFILRSTDLPKM